MKLRMTKTNHRLLKAMVEVGSVAASTADAAIYNKMTNLQCEIQIQMGIRKETDAVPVVHQNQFCPICHTLSHKYYWPKKRP